MKLSEMLRFVLTPHEPDAGWNTRPPEWMVREKAATDGLEPNALDAVARETGIFWLNFADMIAPAIAIYLRASGLASLREDFQQVNDRCEELEQRCQLLAMRDANLWQSAAVALGEAAREHLRADELERLLDSAVHDG